MLLINFAGGVSGEQKMDGVSYASSPGLTDNTGGLQSLMRVAGVVDSKKIKISPDSILDEGEVFLRAFCSLI